MYIHCMLANSIFSCMIRLTIRVTCNDSCMIGTCEDFVTTADYSRIEKIAIWDARTFKHARLAVSDNDHYHRYKVEHARQTHAHTPGLA